jgi:hypothetical protein
MRGGVEQEASMITVLGEFGMGLVEIVMTAKT